MGAKLIVVVASIIAIATILPTFYFFGNFHEVDHQRYFQITGKYWVDSSGVKHDGSPSIWNSVDDYGFHLKGHKDVSADSKDQWMYMPVGSFIVVTWTTWDTYVR